MSRSKQARREALLPGGAPRYVRCYDNGGKTVDRFTVVFTGNYRRSTGGRLPTVCHYVTANSAPFNPQGFYQHGENTSPIDYPTHSHLGRKVSFTDLPNDLQRAVIEDYRAIWNL